MGLIRTALAIAVVWAHSSGAGDVVFGVGRTAVQLFYMISGFLIAHVLTTNAHYRNPLIFYASRALRLYPIYAAVAVLSLLIYRGGNHLFFESYASLPLSADVLLIASNTFIIGLDWVSFVTVTDGHLAFTASPSVPLGVGVIIPQAWTLGVEISFYALAPFIIRRAGVLIALIVLSLLIRGMTISLGVGLTDPWTYRFFPSELALFLLGALSQRYVLPVWTRFTASHGAWHMPKIATALILVAFVLYPLIPIMDAIKIPIFFALFLLLVPLAFLYQNASATDRAIGELSYPIYLCHMLCVLCIPVLLYGTPLSGSIMICPIIIVTSIVFAWGLNRYVGVPVEAFRRRLVARSDASVKPLHRTPEHVHD
jgi:peptidoglycan/LPS O-acetylase OafA/YrhL